MSDSEPRRTLPHELDVRERFIVRFAFVSKAALYCLAAGIIYGTLVEAFDAWTGTWWLLP